MGLSNMSFHWTMNVQRLTLLFTIDQCFFSIPQPKNEFVDEYVRTVTSACFVHTLLRTRSRACARRYRKKETR